MIFVQARVAMVVFFNFFDVFFALETLYIYMLFVVFCNFLLWHYVIFCGDAKVHMMILWTKFIFIFLFKCVSSCITKFDKVFCVSSKVVLLYPFISLHYSRDRGSLFSLFITRRLFSSRLFLFFTVLHILD
jgi:hypothetical protein